MIKGQWARVYDDLHPDHQALFSRDVYVNCRQGDNMPSVDVEVDETYEETISVSRLGEMDTHAVTLELSNEDDAQFITMHVVDVDGEWKWFATEESIAVYEQGECA